MNYEKMWNEFKYLLAKEVGSAEKGRLHTSVHKNLLADMGAMEALEYERVKNRCCEHPELDENAGRKEPGEILKKFFGGDYADYADSLKDLENKMKGKTGGMIFVAPEVEFTEDILNEAKVRGTRIAHVSCQEFCMEIPRSQPPFLNGGRFA